MSRLFGNEKALRDIKIAVAVLSGQTIESVSKDFDKKSVGHIRVCITRILKKAWKALPRSEWTQENYPMMSLSAMRKKKGVYLGTLNRLKAKIEA